MRPNVLSQLQLLTFAVGCAVTIIVWLQLWWMGRGCLHAFVMGMEQGFGIAVASGFLLLIYLCAFLVWKSIRVGWLTLIGNDDASPQKRLNTAAQHGGEDALAGGPFNQSFDWDAK